MCLLRSHSVPTFPLDCFWAHVISLFKLWYFADHATDRRQVFHWRWFLQRSRPTRLLPHHLASCEVAQSATSARLGVVDSWSIPACQRSCLMESRRIRLRPVHVPDQSGHARRWSAYPQSPGNSRTLRARRVSSPSPLRLFQAWRKVSHSGH